MSPRELLETVKTRIMADPKSYRQTEFCGTQCCIAGHIDAIVNGAEFHNARGKTQTERTAIDEIEQTAVAALGEEDSPWLFGTINADEYENDPDEEQCPEYWPLDLSIEYETCSDAHERAVIGCKAIDRYLEERGLRPTEAA